MKIEVVDNNIYPTMYPVKLNIEDEIYEKYINSKENINEKITDERLEKINKFYSELIKINDNYYASYNNYEMQYNPDIKSTKRFYTEEIIECDSKECDYLIKIGDDIGDYLSFVTSSQFLNSKKLHILCIAILKYLR